MVNNAENHGGLGGSVHDDLLDRRGQRSKLSMIDRGLRDGWLSPMAMDTETAEVLPRIIRQTMDEAKARGDMRTVHRAAAILIRMAEYNLTLAATVDKADDPGDTTQRIEVVYRDVADASRMDD